MEQSNEQPMVTTTNNEIEITDYIDITIKTIDSKNFLFQVKSDVCQL